ncbi:MAG: ribulose-phosphate 3-epimerase [Oscillospiraceae bacterium]|nr:ribulose-phosphate 3-epimerase [Oscillospiraceae bacterium]
MQLKIAPSILAADYSKLGLEIQKLDAAGADLIHIDVMDGNFVPNLTIGPPIIKALRAYTKIPFDVHLMIANPDSHIEAYADAGADIICVHVETCPHLHRTLQHICSLEKSPAVALNPHTPLSEIEWILEDVDMVLLMSVNPGFGGQRFISSVVRKIEYLRRVSDMRGLTLDIEVDGGIDSNNIQSITQAGANVIVSGTALFSSADIGAEIEKMRKNAIFSGRETH